MSKYKNANNLLEEKATNKEKKPIYATRKLSIGLVSCMLGILSFMPQVMAEGEEGPVTNVSVVSQNPSEGTETQNPSDSKENNQEGKDAKHEAGKAQIDGEANAPIPVPVLGQNRSSNLQGEQTVKEVLTAEEIAKIKEEAKNQGYEFTDEMIEKLKVELEKIKDKPDFQAEKNELIEKTLAGKKAELENREAKVDSNPPKMMNNGHYSTSPKGDSSALDGYTLPYDSYMGDPNGRQGKSKSGWFVTYKTIDEESNTIKNFYLENQPSGSEFEKFVEGVDDKIVANKYGENIDKTSVNKKFYLITDNGAKVGLNELVLVSEDAAGNILRITNYLNVKTYLPVASGKLTATLGQKEAITEDQIKKVLGIYYKAYDNDGQRSAIVNEIKNNKNTANIREGIEKYKPIGTRYSLKENPSFDKVGTTSVIALVKYADAEGKEIVEEVEIPLEVVDTEKPSMKNGHDESWGEGTGSLDGKTLAPIFMGEETGRTNYNKGSNYLSYKVIDNSGTIVDVKAEGLPSGTTLEEFKKGVDDIIKATEFDKDDKKCVVKKLWVKADSKAKEGLYSFTVTAKDPSGNTKTVVNKIEVKVYVPAAKDIIQAEIYDNNLTAGDGIGVYHKMYDNNAEEEAIKNAIADAIDKKRLPENVIGKDGYLPEGTSFKWKIPNNTYGDLNLLNTGLTERTVELTYTNKEGIIVTKEVRVLINVRDTKAPIIWRAKLNTGLAPDSPDQLDGKDFGGHSAFIGDDNSLNFTYRTGDNSGQIKSFTAEGAPDGTVFEGDERKGLDANGNRDKLAFSTDEQMLNRKIKIKATSTNKVGDYKITFTSTDNLGENGGNKTVVNNTIPVKTYLPVATKTMTLEKHEDVSKLSPEAYIGAYLEKYDTVKARTKDQVKADIDGDKIDKSKISDDRAKYFPKEGTRYEWVQAPNTNQEPGTYKAKAKVTFTKTDGTEVSEEVLIPYEVKEEQEPTAPSVKTDDQSGDVTVTPATEDKTKSIDVTYTGVDGIEHTVTATKDPTSKKWSVPAGSDISIDADSGVVTVPASKTQAGTKVKAIAKNIERVTNPVTATTKPSAPLISEGAEKGSLEITPQGNTDTLTITYTPKGKTQPETVEIKKDADGKWQNPTDHPGITVDDKGVVTIANGTGEENSEVKVTAKVGNSPATEAKGKIPDVTPPNPPELGLANDKSGDATITPAEDDTSKVTITYVGKDGQKKTVDVEKKNGSWTVPDASGLKLSPDGKTIIVPKTLTKDETEVKAISADEHGNTSNEKLVKVPDKTKPTTPKFQAKDDGSIEIDFPADDATSITVEYIDKDGNKQTAILTKEKDQWSVPRESVFDSKGGKLILPADKVQGGSAFTVKTQDEAGNISDPKNGTVSPDAPTISEKDGLVTITPPANADSQEIVYTPKGSETPVKVTAEKDEKGEWKLPEGTKGLEIDAKTGAVTITKGNAKDGEPIKAITKLGKGNTAIPSKESTVNAPDTTGPAKPSIEAKEDGKVTVTPPSDKDTKTLAISFKDKNGNDQVVSATKDDNGKWKLDKKVEGASIDEKTGTITLDDGLTKAGTDVKATAKDKSENPSEEAQDKAKTLADRTNPKTPAKWKVDNPKKLTADEKKAVKKAIEDANKDENGKSTLAEGTEIVVGDDGTATIKYKDGTEDKIAGTDLVEKKADKKALEEESGKEQSTKADHKYKNADKGKQSAYDEALKKAKEVLGNDQASQDEVDKAKKALEEAAKALNGKETDKSKLQAEAGKEQST
ncbi:hypothetical protein, partial [Anaerococcus tetradius]|uniref:hypothetical protein n=1 Tax=Anaerococcus tetradius TaxID=33036 RepID=UPI0023EF803B